MSKDVILTPEQIAAEERRWLFDAPIAELAEVKGVTVDEAVTLRTDAILQEAAVPIEVTVRPIEPQGKLIGFASAFKGCSYWSVLRSMRCLFKASPQAAIRLERYGEPWAIRFFCVSCCLRQAASPSASSERIKRTDFGTKCPEAGKGGNNFE